jgi:hypothetical protein
MINFDIKEFVENNPKLVTRKESVRYPGLFVLKYHRKVFFDALWTPEVQEFRGMVVDADYNVIVHPFTKVFNRGEQGMDFDLNESVIAVEKINGFMAAATLTEEHGLIVSTTGSLDSDFADMARDHIEYLYFQEGYTYLFEICDQRDPHIIPEFTGAYLIGIRDLMTGRMFDEHELDVEQYKLADETKFVMPPLRPRWVACEFHEVLAEVKSCEIEGYMVRDTRGGVLKLKSPYYLVNKLFARMTDKRFENNWLDTEQMREIVDEEYYPLLSHIQENRKQFQSLDEQQRLDFMREFLEAN